MDTSSDSDDTLPEVEAEVELGLQLSKMALEELPVKDQAVQVERTTTIASTVNTNPDWESEVVAMFEHSSSLSKQLDCLTKQQSREDSEHTKHQQKLQKMKDEATHQHQALLDKLESLRVKLQLNNSKASRKKFQTKKQELMLEKTRAQEETDRLAKELEQDKRKLSELEDEQNKEHREWKEELEKLQVEMTLMRDEVQAAQHQTMKDEVAAVEKQRDVTMARFDAWFTEVRQYLSILQEDSQLLYLKEKPKWEKMESDVLKSQAKLQVHFNDAMQQLQQGRELELPLRISEPSLTPVPMVDVKFNKLMLSATTSQAPPPPGPAHHAPPFPPHRQTYQPRQPLPPMRMLSPPNPSPPPPAHAADKLEQLLKLLGAHFPQCNASELKLLLQQVKSSRGTLAGLSHNELIKQVGFQLTLKQQQQQQHQQHQRHQQQHHQQQQLPMGPLTHLLGPIQRPRTRAPGPQGPLRSQPHRLCLICQSPVDAKDRYPFTCSHTIHGDCIQVWLQSNKNCPFCSAK